MKRLKNRNQNRYYYYLRSQIRQSLIRSGYYSKPAFLIIGAQKAGTSALHNYLTKHPNIKPGREKEIGFFHRDAFYNKGTIYYHENFPLPYKLGKDRITFEATPEYMFYPGVVQRIFSYNPRIKLIVLLRDPVDRAYSAWNMYTAFGDDSNNPYFHLAEYREFDECIQEDIEKLKSGKYSQKPHYVRRGLYWEQLERYFKYFDRKQILIIDNRSLKNKPLLILNQVVEFLQIPEFSWNENSLRPIHVVPYKERLPEKSRARLSEFYKPHNERLYELINYDFGWQ